MKKNYLFAALLSVGGFFTACSDNSETNTPTWQARNDVYLDSIVKVARQSIANQTGEWGIYRDYRIALENETLKKYNKYDSVYVKFLNIPYEGKTPLFTDSVSVFYQGFLIDGTRFDGNFRGTLNTELYTPTTFALSGVVSGWTTSFMKMVPKTEAELYIPYSMGYGTSGNTSIPGYSVLKFHVYLDNVIVPNSK